MVLPLIPIVAGVGVAAVGAAAGAGIAGLTAGKKETTIQTTSTYQPSSIYSPQITTTRTFAPQTTTTTTTSSVFSPQYLYAPQYAISSPSSSLAGSGQVGAETALKTDLKAAQQTTPTVAPQLIPTAQPAVTASSGSQGGLFDGGELGSLMLLGAAGLAVYFIFLKK
jgi:hypothetical protein